VNIGGTSRQDLLERLEECKELLRFDFVDA